LQWKGTLFQKYVFMGATYQNHNQTFHCSRCIMPKRVTSCGAHRRHNSNNATQLYA